MRFAKQLLQFAAWLMIGGAVQAGTPAEATYRIRVPEGANASNLGSGVAIHSQMIVTCSHVVGHRLAKNIIVSHPWSGQAWRAETVAVEPASDLALLWITGAEKNGAQNDQPDRPLATVELAQA